MNEEQKLIKTFFYPLADNKEALNLENDAAFLFNKKKTIITSDMMIEGVHFDNTYNPKILARKLLRINLSDVAAMGASPYGYTLNGLVSCYILAIPFFYNTLLSTILFSILIETVYFLFKKKLDIRVN